MTTLAVFLTVFNRLENLQQTLDSMRGQTNKNFDFYIVNNSDRDIMELIDIPATVLDMKNKYSIYGRYFAVRDVLKKFRYDIIAFIDDDERIPSNYADYCHRQFEPTAVKSFWAFEIADDYWNRKKLNGQRKGHYAGAGGLLAPSELFDVPQLYQCPPEHWIMDDIWLSHVVLAYTNYDIKIFNVNIKFIEDQKATYKNIKPLKSEMAKKYILPYK